MSRVDVLIVTALDIEFNAAREAALKASTGLIALSDWMEVDTGGTTPFLEARFKAIDNPITVALARPTRMGSVSTATLAAGLVQRLRPECLAMCGVCAGNPTDVCLGDVIIADTTYAYDEGKRTAQEFQGDHRQMPMLDAWVRAAQALTPLGLPSHGTPSPQDRRTWLLEQLLRGKDPRGHPARERYFPTGEWSRDIELLQREKILSLKNSRLELTAKGRRKIETELYLAVDPPTTLPFSIKVGPIATGNVVVKDGITWDALKRMGVRSVLGPEMEAASIASVAREYELYKWVVAKGVMDHADEAKNDKFKLFAAAASAEVLFRFIAKQMNSNAASQKISDAKIHGMGSFYEPRRKEITEVDRLSQIVESGELRAGIIAWHPSLADCRRVAGKYEFGGLIPEIAQRVADENHLRLVARPIGWYNAEALMKSGGIDIVLPGFHTPTRAEYSDQVAIMHRVGVAGIMRANDPRSGCLTERDLSDPLLRIAVAKFEIGWEYASKHLDIEHNRSRFWISEEQQLPRLAGLLQSEEVDIILVDAVTCEQISRNSGGKLVSVLSQSRLYNNDSGVLIPKGQERLKAWIQEKFDAARAAAEIIKKEDEMLKLLEGSITETRRQPK